MSTAASEAPRRDATATRRRFGPVEIIVAVLAIVAAIVAFTASAASESRATIRNKVTLIAPAAPGGGYDSFARAGQQAMREDSIVNNVQVVNVPGAGGTIGLSQVANMQGRDDLMLVTGAAMVGGIEMGNGGNTFDDVTLLARVSDDYNAIVVPADSPYQSIADLQNDLRANGHAIAIGGGSMGSSEYIMLMQFARASGVDPKQVNYVAFAGGGEATTAILSHSVAAGVSGYNDVSDQIESGRMRLLALSAPEPVKGLEGTTFKEQGVDVVSVNWRGYVAPPGISDSAKTEMLKIIREMTESESWHESLKRNEWTSSYMDGAEFESFLKSQIAEYRSIIEELGLRK